MSTKVLILTVAISTLLAASNALLTPVIQKSIIRTHDDATSLSQFSVGKSKSALSLADAPPDFGPQIQPAQQALAVIILAGFAVTQYRIQKSNSLAEQVVETEKLLKQAKASQLTEGGEESTTAMAEVAKLEKLLKKQSEQSLRLKTFLDLPGLTLRFRTPSRGGSSLIGSDSGNSGNSDKSIDSGGDKAEDSQKEKEQRGLEEAGENGNDQGSEVLRLTAVFLSTCGLLYILQLMATDPIASIPTGFTQGAGGAF